MSFSFGHWLDISYHMDGPIHSNDKSKKSWILCKFEHSIPFMAAFDTGIDRPLHTILFSILFHLFYRICFYCHTKKKKIICLTSINWKSNKNLSSIVQTCKKRIFQIKNLRSNLCTIVVNKIHFKWIERNTQRREIPIKFVIKSLGQFNSYVYLMVRNFLFAWSVSMVAMERAVFSKFIQWGLSCFETYRFRILYFNTIQRRLSYEYMHYKQ